MDSPLAKALMGKRVDDEIILHKPVTQDSPGGEELYYILEIEYRAYD